MTTRTNRETQDLVEVLVDAHGRGREVLDSALNVLRGGAGARIPVAVAATVHRFLTVIEPRHELDEEQLIFPALRAHGPRAEVEAALAHLVDAHVAFDAVRDDVALLWRRSMDAPLSTDVVREGLIVKLEKLARRLGRHMAYEERVVFPLVRRYIPADVQARIAAVLSCREVDA